MSSSSSSTTAPDNPPSPALPLLLTLTPTTTNPFLASTTPRLRSALSRVQSSPYDVEAWQALVTESQILFRQTIQLPSGDPDREKKLDWIESVYGSLLKIFPYSATHIVSVVEMLYIRSARRGEEHGGGGGTGGGVLLEGEDDDDAMKCNSTQLLCEKKMEKLLEDSLGVSTLDGENQTETNEIEDDDDDTKSRTKRVLGGMCTSSIDLWILYIQTRTRDATRAHGSNENGMISIRKATTAAYEQSLKKAGFVTGAHVLWRRYLNHVQSWLPPPNPEVESSGGSTAEEHAARQEQMQALRSVYQRIVGTPMHNLEELWKEYGEFERGVSETLAGVLLAEHLPRFQHARNVYTERSSRGYIADYLKMCTRLPVPPVLHEEWKREGDAEKSEVVRELSEEREMILKWRRRCAYERTNPERLSGAELSKRVRQSFKEMVCGLMRHPEVWHEWSVWEGACDGGTLSRADAVLHLAMNHIPDCALLAASRAELLESAPGKVQFDGSEWKGSEAALHCLQKFVQSNPCSLGFVLLQKLTRKYKGIAAARQIFSQARRELSHTPDDNDDDRPHHPAPPPAPAIADNAKPETPASAPSAPIVQTAVNAAAPPPPPKTTSPITHHVYSTHATIEQHLNHLPTIAARTYELGIRKHPSFLSVPSYILPYADLLLQLNREDDLRALLLRSIAACDERKQDSKSLWDYYVKLECNFSSNFATVSELQKLELKRQKSLSNNDNEQQQHDDENTTVDGIPKSIMDQLVRSDGYETANLISLGLNRIVDRFEITGLIGDTIPSRTTSHTSSLDHSIQHGNNGGGPSDASFAKRFHFHRNAHLLNTTSSQQPPAPQTTILDRSRAARERMQLQTNLTTQKQFHVDPKLLPEWLRSLVQRLPPISVRNRFASQKPPPHMIEMALALLKHNALPQERPQNDDELPMKKDNGDNHHAPGTKRKRHQNGYNDDSSDDDTDMQGGGGYGNQFRSRQRARQMMNDGEGQVLTSASS